jgi:hypothetical protein
MTHTKEEAMPETQPAIARISIAKAVEAVFLDGVRRAVVFQHPNLTIVATRRHKGRKGERITEILLTIGKPNFRNRKFVKDYLKAGEPFPVRKVQLQFWPEKKASRK